VRIREILNRTVVTTTGFKRVVGQFIKYALECEGGLCKARRAEKCGADVQLGIHHITLQGILHSLKTIDLIIIVKSD